MLSMHELSLSMPEPMLSLSMTILAKSSDLGQMICLNSDAYHLTLCYSLRFINEGLGMPNLPNPFGNLHGGL